MYIETVRNRNSPPAILLREGWREGKKVRKRTLANLSHLPKNIIELIRRALKGEAFVAVSEAFEVIKSSLHGHVNACRTTMRRLRFDKLLASKPCRERNLVLFFTLNREDFSFVIHLDRQPRTSRRREAQTGSRARSGSRSERTLDAVEHSRTLMEWWPFLIFHRGGLRIKVINNTWSRRWLPHASSNLTANSRRHGGGTPPHCPKASVWPMPTRMISMPPWIGCSSGKNVSRKNWLDDTSKKEAWCSTISAPATLRVSPALWPPWDIAVMAKETDCKSTTV